MNNEFLNNRVIVKVGDITKENVDAIVNAANSTLLGVGGVDGAIHRAGGTQILDECREIRRQQLPEGLPTGEAVITGGGNLRARFVIHTVGPVYGINEGRDAELLANCYKNSLSLAFRNNIQSVAFPSISTGVFAYPKYEAAKISSEAIKEFVTKKEAPRTIYLVFFSEIDAQQFVKHQNF
jgi:O-acetyl-ADP-ribose deacetylase (regulator of RNase III)